MPKTPMGKEVQSYPDGMVCIYNTKNQAAPGKKPVMVTDQLRAKLPYAQKTVGAMRYYQGLEAGFRIDNKLRVPLRKTVTVDDVAITHDGVTYIIRQVQYPEDVSPPSMDLSLERTATTDDLIGV